LTPAPAPCISPWVVEANESEGKGLSISDWAALRLDMVHFYTKIKKCNNNTAASGDLNTGHLILQNILTLDLFVSGFQIKVHREIKLIIQNVGLFCPAFRSWSKNRPFWTSLEFRSFL
jgi:hypothetical protein